MSRIRFSRRGFLAGFGASAAALPFIPMPAEAGVGEYPKRIVFIGSANGTVMDEFWPSADFTLGPILEPLAALKDRLIVMRGVDKAAAAISPVPKDHWPDWMTLLTGRQGIIREDQSSDIAGISIDQHIATGLAAPTRFPSIHLGVRTEGSSHRMCAQAAYEPITPQNNPAAAFDTVFEEVSLDPFGMQQLRARRGSVLDTVSSDLHALECEFTGAYREKFQAHLQAIESLEQSLSAGAAANCTLPTLDAVNSDTDTEYPGIIEQQFKIMTHALSCDLTRVGTIMLAAGRANHTWIDIDGSHHGIAHGSEGVTADEATRRGWLIQIDRWYAERFRDFLLMLDAVPEGDGTLLDHTAVVWLHEQTNAGSHQRSDMPVVIGGGLHGALETGRMIDAGGVPHNGMLISLAEAMGVSTPEFGDPSLSNGPLQSLYG
jgi:hypothetical protein